MAPLFSKVDLNKFWHNIQNEETLICAKFGKDLFNISKVIGRKKWPSFLDSQCIYKTDLHCKFPCEFVKAELLQSVHICRSDGVLLFDSRCSLRENKLV